MNPETIEKACQAASDRAAHSNLIGTLALMGMGLLVVFVSYYWLPRQLDRADSKIKEAGESTRKMLEEHEKCSTLMVNALSNPKANVQVVLTTKGVSFDAVAVSKPMRDVS